MTDILESIGRQLAQAQAEHDQLDRLFCKLAENSIERMRIRDRMGHLTARQQTLLAMAAELDATSIKGLMVQMSALHHWIGCVPQNDSTPQAKEVDRQIEKLSYRILAGMEAISGCQREDVFGTGCLPRSLDPDKAACDIVCAA